MFGPLYHLTEAAHRAQAFAEARRARRREQILRAARAVETQPSLIGFSPHLIATATRPPG